MFDSLDKFVDFLGYFLAAVGDSPVILNLWALTVFAMVVYVGVKFPSRLERLRKRALPNRPGASVWWNVFWTMAWRFVRAVSWPFPVAAAIFAYGDWKHSFTLNAVFACALVVVLYYLLKAVRKHYAKQAFRDGVEPQ